jgi:hypothetical protein
MRLGHEPKGVRPRRSFNKQAEFFLRIVQDMGCQRPLMFLRLSLINGGFNKVFAREVWRKYGVCEGNRRTTVDLLSIEDIEMEKWGNQDPRYQPWQEQQAEGHRVNQFVHALGEYNVEQGSRNIYSSILRRVSVSGSMIMVDAYLITPSILVHIDNLDSHTAFRGGNFISTTF